MIKLSANKHIQSRHLVWLALVLTLSLVIWTAFQEENATVDVVESKSINQPVQNNVTKLSMGKNSVPTTINQNRPLIDWEKLNRQNNSTEKKSAILFNEHSWVITPPPPKEIKLPPPPPTAPPVPFAYMGRLDNSPKGNLIYLATQDRSFSVVIGNKVDSFWKLDKEDAEHLYFTYLPLNLPQVLSKAQQPKTQQTSQDVTPEVLNAFSQ